MSLQGLGYGDVDVRFDETGGPPTELRVATAHETHVAPYVGLWIPPRPTVAFQVGANEGQTVDASIGGVGAERLRVDALNIGASATASNIETALERIDAAITTLSESRAELGAFQNRMESTIRNLSVAVENLTAAESRIRDTDMAMEMVEFTRSQILSQAGTAMLAQANVIPQSILSLLG